MSPMSVVAPSKCHRSRRYMAAMQSCIKGKKKCCKFTGHWWQIDCQELPLSFTIIILRNYCSRFMHADRYMFLLAHISVCKRKKRRKWHDKTKNKSESVSEREGKNTRNRVVSFYKSRSLFVGLCVCAQFSNPVHV